MREIESLSSFLDACTQDELQGNVVQGVDLRGHLEAMNGASVQGTVFLGCHLSAEAVAWLTEQGAIVFPQLPIDIPFDPYRNKLYTPQELFDAFDPSDAMSYCRCLDARVYEHWEKTGGAQPPSILETLAQRLHDHAISDAIEELLVDRSNVVAIMGGHALLRSEPAYRAMARIARSLTRKGYFMTSGGGPGAMEATHLGAWMAPYPDAALDKAIEILATAPSYRDRDWLVRAFEVLDRWGPVSEQQESLGIPTWLYGHEPPNPFATHIGKYFANSVREDGLVTIATGGIIYAPGSAGTIQEIFQDATQNHYGTVGLISPMVFFGKRYWTEDKPIYPLLRELSKGLPYHDLLGIEDDPERVVQFLDEHEPVEQTSQGWSFCRHHR